MRALAVSYLNSIALRQMQPSTQTTYRNIINRFCQGTDREGCPHGDKSAAALRREHVVKLMATRAEKGLKQESARRNERLQQVRQGADVGSEVTRLVYPKKQRPYGIFREALAGSVAVGMETKKKNWLLIGAVAVLGIGAVVLLAPYLFRPKVLVTFPVPLSYPGFQVWPTPRTFDQPGTVFLLNRDQIIHVGEVNQPPIKRGDESLMGATTTDTWNGTLLAQYLGTTPAKLNVKSDQKIKVTVQLSGAERWMVTESEHPMNKAISNLGLYDRLDEGTPYLVTEAISVNGIEYDVTVDSSEGGTLEIPEVVSASGSISAEKISGSRYSLKQSFSQPHYVFYMANRVIRSDILSRDYPYIMQPVDYLLGWKREELPR